MLAIKFADGVMVASDMLGACLLTTAPPSRRVARPLTAHASRHHAGAYGATKRYKSVERIKARAPRHPRQCAAWHELT